MADAVNVSALISENDDRQAAEPWIHSCVASRLDVHEAEGPDGLVPGKQHMHYGADARTASPCSFLSHTFVRGVVSLLSVDAA